MAASCVALFFIVRAKKSFFLDSRFFIALATVGYICYLAGATYSDLVAPLPGNLDTVLIAVMGISVAMASYLVRNNEITRSTARSRLKIFISKPPRPFLVFLSVMFSWVLASFAFVPYPLTQAALNGPASYLLIGLSVLLLLSFVGLPVFAFYRQSRVVKEKTASLSIKIISLCWASFGVSMFFQIIGGAWLPATQSFGFVVDSFLFMLIAFALREPTVLARIITAGETVNQAMSVQPEGDTIILYNTESDRKRLIETFVAEGTSKGQTVVCRVTKAEVPFYRAVLKSAEREDPTASQQDVVIQPIEVAASLTHSPEATPDSRELIDLDELGLERAREIIEDIVALDSAERGRNGRIWAVNVEGAQVGIVDLLTGKNPTSRVIDLARQQDMFASRFGLKHPDILGRRMLLEYEPTSDYESAVREFVREFQANVESVAIFTNAGSPLYREFSDQKNIRLFTLSTKTSTPARLSNEQVLLPERDTSLFLDAVDKLLQADAGKPIGIVFEVFTYLILSLGFEKAYGVISSIVEMAESEKITILVLVNYEALEDRTLNGLRGLFQSQLRIDSMGLRSVRFARDEHHGGIAPRELEGQASPRRIEA